MPIVVMTFLVGIPRRLMSLRLAIIAFDRWGVNRPDGGHAARIILTA